MRNGADGRTSLRAREAIEGSPGESSVSAAPSRGWDTRGNATDGRRRAEWSTFTRLLRLRISRRRTGTTGETGERRQKGDRGRRNDGATVGASYSNRKNALPVRHEAPAFAEFGHSGSSGTTPARLSMTVYYIGRLIIQVLMTCRSMHSLQLHELEFDLLQ